MHCRIDRPIVRHIVSVLNIAALCLYGSTLWASRLSCETVGVAKDLDSTKAIRDVRRRLVEQGPDQQRNDQDFERVSLPYVDGEVLRDLMIDENAMAVIEIGLAYGTSALAIGEALTLRGSATTSHLIIDPYQDQFQDLGWDAITAAGLADRSRLIRERSQLALPRLVDDGIIADAAFVDGSHHFHNVFVDLYFLRELVRPGGLVVLDDCQWPSVATAVRYFEVNAEWRPVEMRLPTRLRAFRLPDPLSELPFDHFEPFQAIPEGAPHVPSRILSNRGPRDGR